MKRSAGQQRVLGVVVAVAALCPLSIRAQAPSSETTLQEITVTATRQSERLSRVAASVTALDQQKLDQEGVRNVADISRLTPGVLLSNSGFANTTDISIRGIGSTVGASTTGVYIDDTPVQVRSLGFGASNPYPQIFDLARVEILRGPQGTLFGAGSEGGTVRFITPQPSLTEYSGYARSELAYTQDGSPSEEGGAAIGGPIVNGKLGFRASAWVRHTGGYVDRLSNTDLHTLDSNSNYTNAYVGRVALAYVPIDNLTITPSIYYQQVYNNNSMLYFPNLSSPDDGVYRTAEPLGSPSHERFYLPSLNIQAELGPVTLTSVTSEFVRRGDPDTQDYTHFMPMLLLGPTLWDNGQLALPGLPNYFIDSKFYNKQDTFTQELRLQTADRNARLTWIVGAFVQRARQQDDQVLYDPMLPDLIATFFGGLSVTDFFGVPMLNSRDSYISRDISHDNQEAVFGEVGFRIVDGLKATVGLRYARTHFTYSNFQGGSWASTTGLGTDGKQDENPTTPKFGLTWQINDANMVYTTIAKGYRIGGANKPIPVTNPACQGDLDSQGITANPGAYNSDHVWSYEIGSKNSLLGGRLQLYSSAYYIKWQNIQQSVSLTHCGFNYVSNLGSAVSKGADVQFQAQLGEHLNLSGSVAYDSAYYNENVFGALDPASGQRGLVVAEGEALPSIPWTTTLSGEYVQQVFGRRGYARLTYSHSSHNTRLTPAQDPRNLGYDPDVTTQPVTNLTNGRIGVRAAGIDISLFANNLFNSHPRLTHVHDITGSALFFDTTFVPRTVGITGTYNF